MNQYRLIILSFLLASSVAMLNGCAAPGTLEEAENRDRGIGAVVGAVIGAVVGDQVAQHTGGDRTKARAVGGAIGAGAGYVVGDAMAEKRHQYANELESIDGSIVQTEENIRKLQYRADMADRKSKELQQQLDQLKAKNAQGAKVNQEASQLLASIETQLGFTQSTIFETQSKIDSLTREIDQSGGKGAPASADLVKLKELKSMQRDALLSHLNTLTNAKQSMIAQQQAVDNLRKG